MASWEDEDFEVPVAATSNLAFDEEEDGLLDDWEAGLESDDESKPKVAKPKISSAQRIADRKRKEQEERERKALEKTQEANKLEQRQKEIESDLNNASDLLSSVDVHPRAKSNKDAAPAAPAGPTKLSDLAIFKPTNAREYADLRKTLAGVLNGLKEKNSQMHHVNFIIELCRDICQPLSSDQTKRVDATLAALSNDQYREERAKRLNRPKPNLKMAAQKNEKPVVDIKAPEDIEDDGLDDGDFICKFQHNVNFNTKFDFKTDNDLELEVASNSHRAPYYPEGGDCDVKVGHAWTQGGLTTLWQHAMICVECAAPIQYLYTYYSEDNIHATKCLHCGKFADKYIECDRILTFIDLILLRKEAVRHVVFNANLQNAVQVSPVSVSSSRSSTPQPSSAVMDRAAACEEPPKLIAGIPPTMLKLIAFVIMFDVYLLWAMSERSLTPSVLHFLVVTHPVVQHLMFMALCLCDTLVVNVVVRTMAWYFLGWKDGGAISTSLLIGSFFKLLPILTLIWHYDIPFAEQIVQYFSLYCITEVLEITLGCGYFYAGLFTFVSRCASILLNKLFWALV